MVIVPSSSSDARDGFKLAVDESPDVSHPVGMEAGDHLGGIDVEITYLEDSQLTKLEPAIVNGTGVLAIISTKNTVDTVRSTNNIDRAFVVSAGIPVPQRPGWIVLVDAQVEASRLEDFRTRFQSIYGRAPTKDAFRGYDAAKVLDLAIASTGEGINGTTARTFSPDNTRLLASTTEIGTQNEDTNQTTSNSESLQRLPQARNKESGLALWQKGALAALAGIAACTLAFTGLRRLRR